MLDLSKLLPQFDGINAGVLGESADESAERAAFLLARAAAVPDEFAKKLELNSGLTFWPLASPLEPINMTFQTNARGAAQSVVAVDGSQIMPSQHEVYNCYLINIGKVSIRYGHTPEVLLDSTPHLFHTVDDLYPTIDRRRMYVDETFVGLERSLLELSTLRDLALSDAKDASDMVALGDGSLIAWSLRGLPEAYRRQFLSRTETIMASFASKKIPVIGYISHSRSSDVINTLRVWQCPYERSTCSSHCGSLCEEDYPCSTIWPATDRQLFSRTLPRNTRTALFESAVGGMGGASSKHDIVFTYVNVGAEVARLEIPRWVAEDKSLLDKSLSTVMAQADKGAGYPVSLAEAHNLAVIRGAERTQFFELIKQHLIGLGVEEVRVSAKETGKRRGIV